MSAFNTRSACGRALSGSACGVKLAHVGISNEGVCAVEFACVGEGFRVKGRKEVVLVASVFDFEIRASGKDLVRLRYVKGSLNGEVEGMSSLRMRLG